MARLPFTSSQMVASLALCCFLTMSNAQSQTSRELPDGQDAPITDVFQDAGTLALVNAALNGDVVLLDELVASGADINARGIGDLTPLFWSIAKRNADGTKALLESGADPNLVSESGFTVLYLAIVNQSGPEIVRALIENGADPNGKTGSYAPILTQAVHYAGSEVFRLLVDAGAIVDSDHLVSLALRRRYADLAFAVESGRATEDALDSASIAVDMGIPGSAEKESEKKLATARVNCYLSKMHRPLPSPDVIVCP